MFPLQINPLVRVRGSIQMPEYNCVEPQHVSTCWCVYPASATLRIQYDPVVFPIPLNVGIRSPALSLGPLGLLVQDLICYSTLMSALEKAAKWPEALRLFEKMCSSWAEISRNRKPCWEVVKISKERGLVKLNQFQLGKYCWAWPMG